MKRAVVSLAVVGVLAALVAPQATAASRRITLETVPALRGIPVVFDGRVYRTNHGGRVYLPPSTRSLRGRIFVRDVRLPGRIRATFARWYGNLDRPSTLIRAALDIHYLVRWRFTDLQDRPVRFGRVTSISFKASHGHVHKFETKHFGRWQWFQGSRVISTPEGPRSKDLYYTVEKVIVDGTNVVNRAQQRFEPAHRRNLALKLLFYKAEFNATDALFKFPIGSGVKLTFPNGTIKRYAFGPGAKLTIDRLPRGQYWVVVEGPGMSFLRPLTMSKNQRMPLEVLSWFDMGFVIGVLIAIAIGLLLVGRPWLLRYVRPRTYQAGWHVLRGHWAWLQRRSALLPSRRAALQRRSAPLRSRWAALRSRWSEESG
jgi:hypothetical protein